MTDVIRLRDERARVVAVVESLAGEFEGIVAAADLGATDDEHDPEGSTIAFERQRVAGIQDTHQDSGHRRPVPRRCRGLGKAARPHSLLV